MVKKNSQQADNLQELESALTRTEQFIEDNQKTILYAVGVIVIVVGGFLGFNKFYLQTKESEAESQMFMAVNYFDKDSFNLAINGDGNYLGLLDIIDDYGITKKANLAKYYAGMSYLHLGEYETALNYLNKFKTKDLLLAPVAEGSKGDAYLEIGDADNALKQYKKAIALPENELTTPIFMMKAANLLESMEKFQEACTMYENIKTKYPSSEEGINADRYIARVKVKGNL
ncbi:MAG: tetratricopeptide repeat protein [Bacteroidales bacterium]|jgi:predicted negative regulator of RcsB-dependent stress response|nr:tetratricopeptide repeat protein [Bacteroidales bacterium]